MQIKISLARLYTETLSNLRQVFIAKKKAEAVMVFEPVSEVAFVLPQIVSVLDTEDEAIETANDSNYHADASAGAPAPVEVEGFVRVGGDAAGEGSDYRARLLAVERRIQELELLEYEIAAMTPALSADLSLEAANDLAQYMAGRNAPGTAEPGSGEVGFESGETTLARRIRMTEELKLHTKIALDALVSGEDDGRIEAVRARVRAFKEAAYPTVVESVATENEEVTETHAGTGPSEAYQRELARWEVIRLTAKFEFLDGPSKEESEKQGRELRMSKVSSRIVGKITKWREARRQEKRARMLKQRAEWVRELDTLTKSQ